MFTWICPQCGREVPPSSAACPDCQALKQNAEPMAQDAALQPPADPPHCAARAGRVASHLRLLMVLWLAQGVLHLLASLVPGVFLWLLTILAAEGIPIAVNRVAPTQMEGVGVLLLLGMVAWTVACLAVAWGLLNYSRWARTFAIVIGAIALMAYPLGTALGIYTLWVLLPEASADEYRQLAVQ